MYQTPAMQHCFGYLIYRMRQEYICSGVWLRALKGNFWVWSGRNVYRAHIDRPRALILIHLSWTSYT